MEIEQVYARLVGPFTIQKLNADGSVVAGSGRFLGNSGSAKVAMSVEKSELRESYTGQNLLILSRIKALDARLELDLNSIDSNNLAIAYQSDIVEIDGGTVTDEVLGDFVKGEAKFLAYESRISNVVLKSGAIVLVSGVDYKVSVTGVITALKALTNVTADYTFKDSVSLAAFSKTGQEFRLRYDAVLDDGRVKIFTFRRWAPEPAQDFGLVSDEPVNFTLGGPLLADLSLPDDARNRFFTVTEA